MKADLIGRLSIVPPAPVKTLINETWRKKYDALYNRLDPHISLGSALTGDAWKELNSGLVDLLATVSPFEVCLDHVERSATNENTIFLGLRDGRPVVSIQRLLESSFPTLMEKDPDFVPHLSIGWFSEPRARDLAVEAVREHLEEVRFVAGVVSLYRRDQNGFWHPEQDVSLGVEGGGSGCSDL